jgi:hypothetical protein
MNSWGGGGKVEDTRTENSIDWKPYNDTLNRINFQSWKNRELI